MAMQNDDRPVGSIADMVRIALSCRAALNAGQGSAARISDELTYDVTLARLCDRLEIDHDLGGRPPVRTPVDGRKE